jgi:hypothetical protein
LSTVYLEIFLKALFLRRECPTRPAATMGIEPRTSHRSQPQPNSELPADDADARRWGKGEIRIHYLRESASSAGKCLFLFPNAGPFSAGINLRRNARVFLIVARMKQGPGNAKARNRSAAEAATKQLEQEQTEKTEREKRTTWMRGRRQKRIGKAI